MATGPLPEFIEPMLSRRGEPFDSDDYLFEIKWDGTRVLLFADEEGAPPRLRNRRRAILDDRYPERDEWSLPAGTVLDGEMIVLQEGVPDFPALLSRDQIQDEARARSAAKRRPATFVAFDLLYLDFEPLISLPLADRRARLTELLAPRDLPKLFLSEGITGEGTRYFEQAVDRGLEGVMAKRLDSRYAPGARPEHWLKIKREESLLGTVIGVTFRGANVRSLVIAAPIEGELRVVGKVGSGLREEDRERILEQLPTIERDEPLIPCSETARWVEPILFCHVSYLELTRGGEMRAPVFQGWVEAP